MEYGSYKELKGSLDELPHEARALYVEAAGHRWQISDAPDGIEVRLVDGVSTAIAIHPSASNSIVVTPR